MQGNVMIEALECFRPQHEGLSQNAKNIGLSLTMASFGADSVLRPVTLERRVVAIGRQGRKALKAGPEDITRLRFVDDKKVIIGTRVFGQVSANGFAISVPIVNFGLFGIDTS